ncbi:deoxycytidylate deaminase [Candidatus Cardinium hertigii]|uniref:tRNA-specific adenosine deaminase n=1 Tax=Candidatus Cardinium hertigii TaxID=247481 RepID=A0A2Z3LHE6_9BACT|nr:dCMP deaminase family protein [Candidatus Cardinium hertigii]AWN81470.1 tRNA-specific adenosine deaminase [Candidatus Cardinium hertigii]
MDKNNITETYDYHTTFIKSAMELAEHSPCIKKKVGAVLVEGGHIIATGHNGPPFGTYHCEEMALTTGCPRSIRGGCALSIHAEQNTILKALGSSLNLKGSTLYVTLSPCLPCARIIFGVGIAKVVYKDSYATYKQLAIEEGLNFLHAYGITVEKYDL